MRKISWMMAATAMALSLGATGAIASPHGAAPPKLDWSFDGPFGTYDRDSLRRGYQVYTEVCAACHSLDLVRYRNLTALGYSEDQIKQTAARYNVPAGPNESGDTHDLEGNLLTRPALPADTFVAPFPNEQAAKAANGGKAPPELSLIAKSRIGGPNYIVALMTGYTPPPQGFDVGSSNYNAYYPGNRIAMAPPLAEGMVSFEDGTNATVEQMAKDVAQFLMWTAEPRMEDRKRVGLKAFGFLVVFLALMIAVKRRVWSDVR